MIFSLCNDWFIAGPISNTSSSLKGLSPMDRERNVFPAGRPVPPYESVCSQPENLKLDVCPTTINGMFVPNCLSLDDVCHRWLGSPPDDFFIRHTGHPLIFSKDNHPGLIFDQA